MVTGGADPTWQSWVGQRSVGGFGEGEQVDAPFIGPCPFPSTFVIGASTTSSNDSRRKPMGRVRRARVRAGQKRGQGALEITSTLVERELDKRHGWWGRQDLCGERWV